MDRAEPRAEHPLVSVIMPAYNHGRFIAQSIESVCAQTHRPLELIVVDDGSTDSTPAIIEGLAETTQARLDRVVFERQANSGIAKTHNRALSHARGEFVATIGSDDVYLPEMLERLVSIPEWAEPRTAVAFGDAYIIDQHGTRVGVLEDQSTAPPETAGAESRFLAHCLRFHSSPEAPLGTYASILGGAYIPTSSTLVRRSALEAVGGYDEGMFVEDYGLWLRLARERRLVAIPDVLVEKRFHGDNASVTEKRRIFRDVLELMVRERPYARKDPVADGERRSTRDRAYLALRSHGTTADLVRVLARHPLAGRGDVLDARRRTRASVS